jgi:hypothetical protein
MNSLFYSTFFNVRNKLLKIPLRLKDFILTLREINTKAVVVCMIELSK